MNITAKIAFIFTSLSAVHIYDFHKFTVEVITVTITCIWFFNILSLPLQINLICHLRIRPGENQIGDQSVIDDVNIRSFQSFDQQICQEIFTKCCETWIKDALRMDLPRYCAYVGVESVFTLLSLAFSWSFYTICIYLGIVLITMLIFYLNAFNQGWKFINRSFEEDVKNIKNSYMIQSGSHFWVAVWRDKIVGMIGLFEKESYKLKIAELKRLYVSSEYRGKGVATKLLKRAVHYARIHHYDRIFLDTTSAHKDAHRFYKKHGFQLVNVRPFPQLLPTNLRLYDFELEL